MSADSVRKVTSEPKWALSHLTTDMEAVLDVCNLSRSKDGRATLVRAAGTARKLLLRLVEACTEALRLRDSLLARRLHYSLRNLILCNVLPGHRRDLCRVLFSQEPKDASQEEQTLAAAWFAAVEELVGRDDFMQFIGFPIQILELCLWASLPVLETARRQGLSLMTICVDILLAADVNANAAKYTVETVSAVFWVLDMLFTDVTYPGQEHGFPQTLVYVTTQDTAWRAKAKHLVDRYITEVCQGRLLQLCLQVKYQVVSYVDPEDRHHPDVVLQQWVLLFGSNFSRVPCVAHALCDNPELVTTVRVLLPYPNDNTRRSLISVYESIFSVYRDNPTKNPVRVGALLREGITLDICEGLLHFYYPVCVASLRALNCVLSLSGMLGKHCTLRQLIDTANLLEKACTWLTTGVDHARRRKMIADIERALDMLRLVVDAKKDAIERKRIPSSGGASVLCTSGKDVTIQIQECRACG